ncbi:MAG TPA: serine/threonine protein kinase, partial [Polyangiaceae bacterium]|nr:serine/threonine protein kinase [Polyangiaceae bacterium]
MTRPNDLDAAQAAAPVDTTPLCNGRFVPFRRLGAGSQAETLEAVDRADGRVVALKRFDVHGAQSWKDVELAEREARVL